MFIIGQKVKGLEGLGLRALHAKALFLRMKQEHPSKQEISALPACFRAHLQIHVRVPIGRLFPKFMFNIGIQIS